MREIKFRGKRKSDGDLFYGDLVTETNGDFEVQRVLIHVRLSHINFTQDSLTSMLVIHEVEPETVGQYTGMKDKNGTDIFEGDIAKHIEPDSDDGPAFEEIGIVSWGSSAGFVHTCKKEGLITHWLLYSDNMVVIGNIYDNPELLK